MITFVDQCNAPGPYPRDLPLADYCGYSPSPEFACPDCGARTFTLTNRRLACLGCWVATAGSTIDRRTGLYPGEVVCGIGDFARGIVRVDRPIPPVGVPDPEDDTESIDDMDAWLKDRAAETTRRRAAGVPAARPASGPVGVLKAAPIEKKVYVDREFVPESAIVREKARRRAQAQPKGKGRRDGDGELFDGEA